MQNNVMVDDMKGIGDIFTTFYQNLCGTTQNVQIKIN